MAKILTAKPIVEKMRQNLARRCEKLKQVGIVPCLAILRVGDRADEISYETFAIKKAKMLGVDIKQFVLPTCSSAQEIIDDIEKINADKLIQGCLILRPLPTFLDEKQICDLLVIEKDVDGITSSMLGSLFSGETDIFAPCTAQACLDILDFYHINIAGAHVVVVGRSLVVGRPLAMLLLNRDATVTICHSKTKNLETITQKADIVICATGSPKAFDDRYFSHNQVVIDVGVSFDSEGKMCGDVDFQAVEPHVFAITPVPGGVGSLTTSIVFAHTIKSAEKQLRNR